MKAINIEKITEILNEVLENDKIMPNMLKFNLNDFGMDSIKFIQLILTLEEEFECEIPDSKILIPEMDTIEKIVGVLQTLYDEEIS